MSSSAAHLMRPAMRPSAPPAMSNNVQLFMRHHMNNSVQPSIARFVPVVMGEDKVDGMENVQVDMEDVEVMVDMAKSVRRFPTKAAGVSLSRHHLNSALRSQGKTAIRFLSKFQNRTASKFQEKVVRRFQGKIARKFPDRTAPRFLSRHLQKLQSKSVIDRDLDMDMVTIDCHL